MVTIFGVAENDRMEEELAAYPPPEDPESKRFKRVTGRNA